MNDDEVAGSLFRWFRRFLDLLLEFLYEDLERPRLRIVPLDQEGNPMTVTPSPFPLFDNQSLPLGLALENTTATLVSAVWSASGTVGDTPAVDPALTSTATTTPGTEGAGTVDCTATLSDGSTLSATFAVEVSAAPPPPPPPPTLVIVPGTPTP